MRIKETKVFKYDELSDKAKEKARDWFREGNLDHEWWDYIYEDANTIANTLGFDLNVKGKEPCIWFSGFSSQGDGACVEGIYQADNTKVDAFYAHVGKTESNAPIIEIAENFFTFAKEHPTFAASITHTSRYYHEYSVSYECTEEVTDRESENEGEDILTEETEKEFQKLCQSFMRWIYGQLETEHDYLQSDEHVEECIQINEYEFEEDGSIA